MARLSLLSLLLLMPALVTSAPRGFVPGSATAITLCRCFPGELCWPSELQWSLLNATLGGRLVATVPIGHKCHNSPFGPYDAKACEQLRSVWGFTETHLETSSSPMAPFFANQSCDPFSKPDDRCVIGTQVQYAVDARSSVDYLVAIAFAKTYNIRLLVRNTGHDFLGKSTGAGALAIWTHHMKDIGILDYSSPAYQGKAMKMGAGVLAKEAYAAAHAQGLVVVGGNNPTVGLAGGYTQGGGHGPLVSKFGLGADQVLEWEVVTSEGEVLIASPQTNSDLYWALSGGGGGTYAAVLSMTVKAYPDLPVPASNLTFTSEGITMDKFYDVVSTFIQTLPEITAAGGTSIFLLIPGTFIMQPTYLPGESKERLQQLLQPTLDRLDKEGMSYVYNVDDFPRFLDSYNEYNPPSNVTEFNLGGRLIPRTLLQSPDSAAAVTKAFRTVNDNGGVVSGVCTNVAKFASPSPNSVSTAWREAGISAVYGIPYDKNHMETNVAAHNTLTNVFGPLIDSLAPNLGAYINEASFLEPRWQNLLYGNNYMKLKAIKKKYDPADLWYGRTAVGSDNWTEDNDGRLCKSM